MSSIFENWTLYCRFITVKYLQEPKHKQNGKEAVTGKSPTEDKDALLLPDLIRKSTFTRKINEKLLPSFETLYKFYFRRSIEKSITIEELPSLDAYLVLSNEPGVHPEQVPISSVVEDLTLVLNNTLRNIIQSGLPTAVKSFINESFRIVQQDLLNGFFIKT